jgi:spore maturation protein SpmA
MLEFFSSPICFSLLEFVLLWIGIQLIADTASLTSNWITNYIYKKKQK